MRSFRIHPGETRMGETRVGEGGAPPAGRSRDVQVVIIHAPADRVIAETLGAHLRQLGYVTEWGQDIGAVDQDAQRARAEAPCVIALWSRAAAGYYWTLEDAQAAAKREALLEALLDRIYSPLERPSAGGSVDLSRWSGQPDDSPEFQALIDRVRAMAGPPLGRPADHTAHALTAVFGLVVLVTGYATLMSGLGVSTQPAESRPETRAATADESATGMGGPAQVTREPNSAPAPSPSAALPAAADGEDDSGVDVTPAPALAPLAHQPAAPLQRLSPQDAVFSFNEAEPRQTAELDEIPLGGSPTPFDTP